MISFKQIFHAILFIVGIIPNANALMVPFINKDGDRLAFNKNDEFIVDPASKKQISLQFTHLNTSWNPTKEANYNCVRLMCGKNAPTSIQQILITKLTFLFFSLGCSQNSTLRFFNNQLSIMNQINTKALPQENPYLIPLIDQAGQEVSLDKQNKKIFFKLFQEANQENYTKVVLMCGDTPATAEEQKLITKRANEIKESIYDQKETARNVLITFGTFLTQLIIMNSPSDQSAFSLITAQDTHQKFETISNPINIIEKPESQPTNKCKQIETQLPPATLDKGKIPAKIYLCDKTGNILSLSKKLNLTTDATSKNHIFLQLTHLDNDEAKKDSWQDACYNCVQIMINNNYPTKNQEEIILTQLDNCMKTDQSNARFAFFHTQVLVFLIMTDNIVSKKKTDTVVLANKEDQQVCIVKNNCRQKVSLKFLIDPQNMVCSKVILLCDDKPATAEDQKLITTAIAEIKSECLDEFGNQLSSTQLAKKYPWIWFFWKQLEIMNILHNEKSFNAINNPINKNSIIFEENTINVPVAKNTHDLLQLTEIKQQDDFNVEDIELSPTKIDTIDDSIAYTNHSIIYRNITKKINDYSNNVLSIYELSLHKVGDIIFTGTLLINETTIQVQQIKMPTPPPAWATCKDNASNNSFPLKTETIIINSNKGKLIQQLNKIQNTVNIKKIFNKKQILSFLIKLKYNISLNIEIKQETEHRIIVSISNKDNVNATENPIISDICKFLLAK